jgi:hypothetical protein
MKSGDRYSVIVRLFADADPVKDFIKTTYTLSGIYYGTILLVCQSFYTQSVLRAAGTIWSAHDKTLAPWGKCGRNISSVEFILVFILSGFV